MIATGARVRVRPGTDDAEMVCDHPPTGTVKGFTTDRGPHVRIELDDGAIFWSTSLRDWEVIYATDAD